MYAWGSTINGELGLGGIEDEHILTPRILEWPLANTVIEAALGDNHTLFLTKDGKVYSCGNNDYGQLGHDQPRKRPQQVSNLEAHTIVHVACGATHSMALNQWGQVLTWGSDYHGQLGQQIGENIQDTPRIIKDLAKYVILQIACGQRHSVALSNNGDILAWGANTFGQLGLGVLCTAVTNPTVVESLQGVPISFITCGGNHTLVISKSGAVFGWGKNTRGQLGINDTENKKFPQQLRTLRTIRVRYIACGEEFSMFLTSDGGVFTCGSGMYGQLGHGTKSNEILPRQVVELMGSVITQVCCGRQHSLALVPSRGRVYSFGIGGAGQLGLRKPSSALTPQVVLGPWLSPGGTPVVPSENDDKNVVVHRIFTGGDHCFVTVKSQDENAEPYDCREVGKREQILTLNYSTIKEMLDIPKDKPVDQDILTYLETVFRSQSCLNASFLLTNETHYYCNSKHNGVNMELAQKTFDIIPRIENLSIKDLIFLQITELLDNLSTSPPDVESLRLYLTLPLYHEFRNPKHHATLQKPFANALLKLKSPGARVVGTWWLMMSADYFEMLITIFKTAAIFLLQNQNIPEGKTAFKCPSLVAMLDVLAFLNKLNHSVDNLKAPCEAFHISELTDVLDVRVDYIKWLSDQVTGKLFLCNYPFLFDAQAKTLLLETDQSIQMHRAMENAAQQAMMAMFLSPSAATSITQFLVLNVSREHIVRDTLNELRSVDDGDFKKPLKVKFHGEEAEDAGGVKKEFFMLLLRDILDPKYGMFKEYPETRAIWFSESSFEDAPVFFLIGMICGLAIYNFIIIDIPFPLALYKKLLNEPIGLADLKGLSPTVAESLNQLLEYEESDFSETFDLTFEISREIWGENVTFPLKPNGANIPVTLENKKEYVDLYVDFILNERVKEPYRAFHEGFMKVCGGRVLQLFHSQELMAVVVGNENYDWHALEEVAEYKNGYTSSDQTIRWFWEVIHDMTLADKKKFLLFLTGSDRIPIQGMKAIKIIIQQTNDEKFLPVAHTCFNLLDLPKYNTKERLKYKLMQAIQQTEGFSLV